MLGHSRPKSMYSALDAPGRAEYRRHAARHGMKPMPNHCSCHYEFRVFILDTIRSSLCLPVISAHHHRSTPRGPFRYETPQPTPARGHRHRVAGAKSGGAPSWHQHTRTQPRTWMASTFSFIVRPRLRLQLTTDSYCRPISGGQLSPDSTTYLKHRWTGFCVGDKSVSSPCKKKK